VTEAGALLNDGELMSLPMEPGDIELGNESLAVQRRLRAGVVLTVRLSAEEADQPQTVADEFGITLSRAGHTTIKKYLSDSPT
jgi:hypothetical protein